MTTTATAEITADQTASGTCAEGAWTASRFGTLVVVDIAGLTDDTQYGDEATAAAEFAALVESLSE